jgi:hypothetical protein
MPLKIKLVWLVVVKKITFLGKTIWFLWEPIGFFRNHTQESINKIKLTRVRQYIYLYDLFDQSLIYIFSSFREAIKLLGANQPALR